MYKIVAIQIVLSIATEFYCESIEIKDVIISLVVIFIYLTGCYNNDVIKKNMQLQLSGLHLYSEGRKDQGNKGKKRERIRKGEEVNRELGSTTTKYSI